MHEGDTTDYFQASSWILTMLSGKTLSTRSPLKEACSQAGLVCSFLFLTFNSFFLIHLNIIIFCAKQILIYIRYNNNLTWLTPISVME